MVLNALALGFSTYLPLDKMPEVLTAARYFIWVCISECSLHCLSISASTVRLTTLLGRLHRLPTYLGTQVFFIVQKVVRNSYGRSQGKEEEDRRKIDEWS